MSMEDMMRAFRQHAESEAPKPPALIVDALRDQAQFYARENPFNVGDIVTPRMGSDVKGAGTAHIVVAVEEDPSHQFDGEPASNTYGQRRDIRVLRWVDGRFPAHWVESSSFELWVDPALAADPAPSAEAA